MEKISLSDEAFVMTVIAVKIHEINEESASTAISDLGSQQTEDVDDAASGTRRKRKSKKDKGGGRKKRRVEQSGKMDPEVGNHKRLYLSLCKVCSRARSVTGTNDDENGWHQAIADELETTHKARENLERTLVAETVGNRTNMPHDLSELMSETAGESADFNWGLGAAPSSFAN